MKIILVIFLVAAFNVSLEISILLIGFDGNSEQLKIFKKGSYRSKSNPIDNASPANLSCNSQIETTTQPESKLEILQKANSFKKHEDFENAVLAL